MANIWECNPIHKSFPVRITRLRELIYQLEGSIKENIKVNYHPDLDEIFKKTRELRVDIQNMIERTERD